MPKGTGRLAVLACRLTEEAVVVHPGGRLPLKELYAAGRTVGVDFAADGNFGGTPRSVAFNAQWFRLAVDPGTGEIRTLRSVHAADAGKDMNPMQCRGQVEGGVARCPGRHPLRERPYRRARSGRDGRLPPLPAPQYADIPRTEVHFMETADAIGPLGAKSMIESPFNPVAPAFANALRDATDVRFTELPLNRDRVWAALREQSVSGSS